MTRVFLGGTCAESTWREELVSMLDIDYFNPVVDDWNEEAQAEEIRQRQECEIVLYVLTSEMQGVYAVAEVVDDSNKRPGRTVFCYLPSGFTEGQIKSLEAVRRMVESNGAQTARSLHEVAAILNAQQR